MVTFRNAFFDFFWLKEPRELPQLADYFLNRIIETSILIIINSGLGLFVLYVILTQSANLGSFKYYLWNHFLVSQTLEFGLLLFSPALIGSYVSLFTSGIFRNILPTQIFYYFLFVGLSLFVRSLTGIYLTLFNRFVFLFRPQLIKRIHNKYALMFLLAFHAFYDGVYIYSCYASAVDHETMEIRAHIDAGNTLDRWFNEKSLIYIPEFYGRTRAFAFIGLCVLIIMFFTLIGIIIWFIVNVFILKKMLKTVSANSAFLLIAVLAQTGCFLVFFLIPSIVILYCWAFAKDDGGNVVNVAMQLFTFHGTIDMLVLLYFVKPYKVYCINCMRRVFCLKKRSNTAMAHQSVSVY